MLALHLHAGKLAPASRLGFLKLAALQRGCVGQVFWYVPTDLAWRVDYQRHHLSSALAPSSDVAALANLAPGVRVYLWLLCQALIVPRLILPCMHGRPLHIGQNSNCR